MADWPALKNASILLVFPLYDGSGCRVTAGAGLAACVSIDGAAMAITSCGSAMAELNSGAGLYKLTLLAAEMNGDVIGWKAVSTTASARDAMGVIYTATRQMKDLAFPNTTGRGLYVDTLGNVTAGSMLDNAIHRGAIAGSALAASTLALNAIDANSFATVAGSKIWDAAVRTITGTVTVATNNDKTGYSLAASAIGASQFATGAIDGVAFALTAASKVWDAGVRALTAGVTVTTNNDKTGYSLAASAIGASQFATGGIDGVAFALSAASKVWDAGVRALTAGVTVTTNNDKTGYVLAASAIAASAFATNAIDTNAFGLTAASKVWDAAVRALTAGVTVTTNNDKTGYVLAASSIAASTLAASAIDTNSFGLTAACTVWNPAVRAITGTVVVATNNDKTGYVLAASSIGASTFAASSIDTNAFGLTAACTMWNPAVRAITGTVTVATNNDKTGYALAASSIAASTFATDAIDKNSFATNAGSKVWDAGVRTLTALGASSISVSVFADSAASRVAEVVLTGITLTEMPQAQPTATPTLASAIQALYMAWRNSASTSSGCIMVQTMQAR